MKVILYEIIVKRFCFIVGREQRGRGFRRD